MQWAGHSLATTSANVDADLLRFSSWLQATTKATSHYQSKLNTQKLAQLKVELKNLEAAIQQKFPDGRPTGIGVLAIIAPGDVTIGGLKKMLDTINSVQRDHGLAAGCAAALVSTVVIPFIITWGKAADTFLTIGEIVMGNPKHGSPAEYDRAMREIRAIRQKVQSAGTHGSLIFSRSTLLRGNAYQA